MRPVTARPAPSWRARSAGGVPVVVRAMDDHRRRHRAQRPGAIEVVRKDIDHAIAPHIEGGIQYRKWLDGDEVLVNGVGCGWAGAPDERGDYDDDDRGD